MKAIVVPRFGGPEVLVWDDAPPSGPGPGEVAIAVDVADVLFVDALIRAGAGEGFFPHRPPFVPGNGVAGRVSAVGAGVDATWEGRPVVAHTGGDGGWGGYTERAVVDAGALVAIPAGVPVSDAAALLHDGVTALRLTGLVNIQPGERVLVVGASGALGILLVQLARDAGAFVVGTARGDAKRQLVSRSGAHAVVDPTGAHWTAEARAFDGGRVFDVVFDGVGGSVGAGAVALAAPGGRITTHGSAAGSFTTVDDERVRDERLRVTGIGEVRVAPAERRALTERALALAAEGRWHPHVGQTYPLARAADAHTAVEERRVTAKTLLLAGYP